jgi:recombinational DNA repair protein (RecF pathway)
VPLVPVTAEFVEPQAPTTADRSLTLLRAAGVEPQLAACVIQTESDSRSNTTNNR